MAKFNFKNFDSPQLTLAGEVEVTTVTPSTKAGWLRGNDFSEGNAFYSKPISIKDKTSFSSFIQFQYSPEENSRGVGDGLVFVLSDQEFKDDSSRPDMGYFGFSSTSPHKIVGVEFDTEETSSKGDPNDNHIGLNAGDFSFFKSVVTAEPKLDIDGGGVVNAWIDYNGKNDKFEVFLSDNDKKPKKPTLSTQLDVSSVLEEAEEVYAGLGLGTDWVESLDVFQWQFETDPKKSNPKPKPKPSKGIEGDNKNNELEGTNKNDDINGGGGNDTLIGGKGNDILTGGGGKDDFLLGSGKVYKKKDLGVDTIKDFKPNVDDIILDTDTFVTLHSKEGQGFSIKREFDVVKNKKAVDKSVADIVYDRSSGDLYYNANGALPGLGGGNKIATLDGAPKIGPSDFVLQ